MSWVSHLAATSCLPCLLKLEMRIWSCQRWWYSQKILRANLFLSKDILIICCRSASSLEYFLQNSYCFSRMSFTGKCFLLGTSNRKHYDVPLVRHSITPNVRLMGHGTNGMSDYWDVGPIVWCPNSPNVGLLGFFCGHSEWIWGSGDIYFQNHITTAPEYF